MSNKYKEYYFNTFTREIVEVPDAVDNVYGKYVRLIPNDGDFFVDTYRLNTGQYIDFGYTKDCYWGNDLERWTLFLDCHFELYGVTNKNPVLVRRQMPKDVYKDFVLSHSDFPELKEYKEIKLKDLTLEEILDIMDNGNGGCTGCPLYRAKDFPCYLYCDANKEKKKAFSEALEENIYLEV